MIDYSLYLVTDEKIQNFYQLKDMLIQAIRGGITIVQLREKKLSTNEYINKAKQIKKILDKKNIPLIINDRIDVALAVDASGVHIGQHDMPYRIARKILGKNKIIGLSISTISQMQKAKNLDVNYFGVGHLFTTPTKKNDHPPLGIAGFKKIRTMTQKKLIAIGGINKTNTKNVIAAGANGIAVVSAICSSSNVKKTTQELKNIVTKNTI
jgi:thiamine-phosphate pyrophosphorylase